MSSRIPFDIQVQIIERLPVKPLLQFRSVCKAWKSFIDSSKFIVGYGVHQHLLLIRYALGEPKKPDARYVCFMDDDTFPQQKFSPIVPPLVQQLTRSIMIGSSHGLMCLSGCIRDSFSTKTKIAALWNPAIRKSIGVVLPLPNELHGRLFQSVIGFWVCPNTINPMLVCVMYIEDEDKIEYIRFIPNQVMVFTLSSGEWRIPRSNLFPRKSIAFTSSQQVIGRFIYWLAFDRIELYGEFDFERPYLIMSFDTDTEEFREIHLPEGFVDSYRISMSRLRERESLVLVKYGQITSNQNLCDVWMMEDDSDTKTFTKLYTIRSPDASIEWLSGFRKGDVPIVEMLYEPRHFYSVGGVYVYEPSSENIKDLQISGNVYSSSVNSYTESLLLLNHNDGHIVRT